MTAQQASPTQLFHIPAHSTDPNMLQWMHNEIQIDSKKRRRSLVDDTIEKEFIPQKKSPRIFDEQTVEQLVEKPNQNDILLAYKRIWNKLDLNSPADAKLEPFIWRKIRDLQQNK